MNETYQKQLQSVLQDKEEFMLSQAGLEDKIEKLELDREQLKLRLKQTQEQFQQVDKSNSERQAQVKTLTDDLERWTIKYQSLQKAHKQEVKQIRSEEQVKQDEISKKLSQLQLELSVKCEELKETQKRVDEKEKSEERMV